MGYKTAKLGNKFLWHGELTEVVTIITNQKVIGFKTIGECPHCGKEVDVWHDEVESSPNFQEGAKPITTITED